MCCLQSTARGCPAADGFGGTRFKNRRPKLSAVFFPVFPGRCGEIFPKAPGKMVTASKAGVIGNAADLYIGFFKEMSCALKLIVTDDFCISFAGKTADCLA